MRPRGRRARTRWLPLLLTLGCGLGAVACAATREPAGAAAPVLRVGTSGDYAPFSRADDSAPLRDPQGFDPALVRAYAADRGVAIQWVRFRWPALLDDLDAGRFDLAASGVTVRPERSLAGIFTAPVAETGAVALARLEAFGGAPPAVAALDRAGVRIAVNAGGHLERVARARFPAAAVLALDENDAVRALLHAGGVDAVVTDTLEAPHWLEGASGLLPVGPFTRDRKAWLVRPDRPALARDLDAWLLARESDGTLDALRARHLAGAGGSGLAAPLPGLLAAMDERLALMPLVAEAKRGGVRPVEDPARERRVLDAALRATREAASAAGVRAPDPVAVTALFRAQVEAAKAIQRAVLAQPAAAGGSTFDLDTVLRPALLRLGDRIAWWLVRLPGDAPTEGLAERVAEALRHAPPGALPALAGGLEAVIASRRERSALPPERPAAQERASARAMTPAITGSTRQAP